MTRITEKIRRWWRGKEWDDGFSTQFDRHWTARTARAVVFFAGREWKWLAGFAVALFMAVMAYLRLP